MYGKREERSGEGKGRLIWKRSTTYMKKFVSFLFKIANEFSKETTGAGVSRLHVGRERESKEVVREKDV